MGARTGSTKTAVTVRVNRAEYASLVYSVSVAEGGQGLPLESLVSADTNSSVDKDVKMSTLQRLPRMQLRALSLAPRSSPEKPD
jgi:mRNA-degrading endonuclease toxin of MazEF toxin-antitoxin module